MISKLDKEAIKVFLVTAKKEILKGHHQFINRTLIKNGEKINSKQALLNIGIIKSKDIWNYILELNIQDCIKVDMDYDSKRDNNTEIYVFKKVINNKMVYIKLTIRMKGLICISFHESY